MTPETRIAWLENALKDRNESIKQLTGKLKQADLDYLDIRKELYAALKTIENLKRTLKNFKLEK